MENNYIFDITAYGAKADGASDSTAAIQAAVNAAAAVHGTVFVPAGRYLCGKIKVPGAVVFEGTYTWNWSQHQGFAGSILQLCEKDAPCLLDLSDAAGTTVNGLSLDGAELGTASHGILLCHDAPQKAQDALKIENCRIGFFTGDGVHLSNINNFSVRHSMLCFCGGYSLYVTGRDGYIIDNWLSGSKWGGGLGLGGDACDMRITANRIEDPIEDGTDINLYDPRENGPHIGCRNIVINNNYICGSKLSGIRGVAADGASLRDIQIVGNAFDSNGQWRKGSYESAHIRLEGCCRVQLCANVFFTKRGFWDPSAQINTDYAICLCNMTDLLLTENAWNDSAEVQDLVFEGAGRGEIVIARNAGREICSKEGYMFPYWNSPQFPDAKRDAAALALTELE